MSLKFSGVPMGNLWTSTVAKAFLEPFGLNQLDAFLAPSQAAVSQIIARNPQYRGSKFLVPQQEGRPKNIVMSSTVEAPDGYKANVNNVASLQVGPDFAGTPFYPNNEPVSYASASAGKAGADRVLLGGGLVQTFAFGGSEPTKPMEQFGGPNVEFVAPVRPFSLPQAVGMSSAAFGGQMTNLGSLGQSINPQVIAWPVTSKEHPRPQKAMTYMVGDGGNLENTGILAMVQRGATKIAAMIQADVPMSTAIDFCTVPASHNPKGEITSQFSNLFGYAPSSDTSQMEFTVHNQIFNSSAFYPIMCELRKMSLAGKPLIIRKQLKVQANSFWGIKGGHVVDIAFFLLDKSSEFESLLPADSKQLLSSGPVGGLTGFPNFKTCFQNGADLTEYTARQINLLAAQTEWSVLQQASIYQELLR